MTLNYNELRKEFNQKQKKIDRERVLTKKTDKELSELRIKEATKGNWNGIYLNANGSASFNNLIVFSFLGLMFLSLFN